MGTSIRLTLASPTQTYSFTTDESSVKIGRSLKCEFNIPKEDLSREHCLFEVDGDDYYVTDLGSKNGICVDRERIPEHVRTKISKDSHVVLSALYDLKINAFEVKTKADMIGIPPKAKTEIETVTFQLELHDEVEKKVRRKPIKRTQREIAVESPTENYEYVKMIAGFVVVIGFLIYHALGE